MHATCEQHTQTSISASKSQYSFSCQLLLILLLYRTQRLLAARLILSGASRQTSRRRSSFLTEQISDSRSPATLFLQISSILQPLSCSPATFHKKTEPSAQFFPLYINSTFPGVYNPQFSSCSTKPKCLRIPAKSGSLLLSSVITGLSFSSHSRLNSINLLPRPL